jgi:hypothetical protein
MQHFVVTILTLILATFSAPLKALEAEVYTTKGERVAGDLTGSADGLQVGGRRLLPAEVLLIRFSSVAPPDRVPSGVFLRGGTMLTGKLDSLLADEVTCSSAVLGKELKFKREDLAGAFFPPASNEPENYPALGRYARLLAALDMSAPAEEGALSLLPGRRDRVTLMNLDSTDGKLMKLGTEKALVELLKGEIDAKNRTAIRLIECKVQPLPPPAPEEKRAGPEVIVRLLAGDLIRGRLTKVDANSVVLMTRFAGAFTIPRETVSVLYPAGGPGTGLEWLSTLKPARNVHTPLYDSKFPARMNLSCDGKMMFMNGLPCDKGLGVHSRSELAYTLKGAKGMSFVALVGIDDETNGRGAAEAKLFVNSKEVWTSAVAPKAAPAVAVADLSAATELKLFVDYGADGEESGDHVNWGWAAIIGP